MQIRDCSRVTCLKKKQTLQELYGADVYHANQTTQESPTISQELTRTERPEESFQQKKKKKRMKFKLIKRKERRRRKWNHGRPVSGVLADERTFIQIGCKRSVERILNSCKRNGKEMAKKWQRNGREMAGGGSNMTWTVAPSIFPNESEALRTLRISWFESWLIRGDSMGTETDGWEFTRILV